MRLSSQSISYFRPLASAGRLTFVAALAVSCGTTAVFGQTRAAPAADPEASAAEEGSIVALPDFVLSEQRVANDAPSSSVATPVSALRFEPRVDLQTRNFGEAQGDIAIRGGIFEGTAVEVGGQTLFDPQTGHYAAELPIPPEMLTLPRVATGLDHALGAFGATAGTVRFGWRPIESHAEVSLAGGSGSLDRESIYAGSVLQTGSDGRPQIGVDGSFAHSRADGTIKDGDHRLSRVGGRMEIVAGPATTEIFGGYQSKFFGWPNLYTPFGVAETENLQTTLVMVNHRIQEGERVFEAGAEFRRNRDDYEFDRYLPGRFNPYQHETRTTGAFARLSLPVASWVVDLRGEAAADSIHSTALTAGHFQSRTYWALRGSGTRRWEVANGAFETRLGAAFDDTNRESSAVSPGVQVAYETHEGFGGATARWYAEVSNSTRVPDYTALNSPADSGLFRGNPDLGREKSRNIEAGLQLRGNAWSMHAALFQRRDDPLVDWTFTENASTARSAQIVDVETTGLELVAAHAWKSINVVAGYTWLAKDADYRGAVVDASFYALNFPRHRVTLAITAKLGGGFELRSDNEFRAQQKNLLRTVGGNNAVLSSLGLYWLPPGERGLELSLVADNLWESDFQELPAVPAPGRQITAGIAKRW